MIEPLPTRRQLLAAAGLTGTHLFLGSAYRAKQLRGAEFQSIERKDVRDLKGDDEDLYREAFKRLQDRGAANNKSYDYQARIHTNHCPHGNWWFFPWHRTYLYYLEQLLQDAVRDLSPPKPPTIPYWNWTEQRDIPRLFRGTYPANRLAHNSRNFQGLWENSVGEDRITRVVDQKNAFTSFGSARARHSQKHVPVAKSSFELAPHDHVHGQFSGGSMSSTLTSAFDPIFWSHHSNIDRFWSYWLTLPNHNNPDENDPRDQPWYSLPLTEFVNTSGTLINRTVKEIMEDPVIQSVVYVPYSGRGPRTVVAVRPKEHAVKQQGHQSYEVKAQPGETKQPVLRLKMPVTLTIPIDAQFQRRIQTIVAPDQAPGQGAIQLRLEGLKLPKDPVPAEIRLFLDDPNATATTSTKDPHFIDFVPLFFFGSEHGHDEGGANALLDLTRTLQAIGTAQTYGPRQAMRVTLVLVPTKTGQQAAQAPQVPENLSVPFSGATLILED